MDESIQSATAADEPVELFDLGDATVETKQVSPFGGYPDSQFNWGLYPG